MQGVQDWPRLRDVLQTPEMEQTLTQYDTVFTPAFVESIYVFQDRALKNNIMPTPD